MTDAEGHVTTTRYWPDGKVWKVIDAKGNNAVVNRYYGDGSLKEVEDAEGNITTYEYNGFKGLARTTYEDDTYEEPTYDSYRRVHETQGRSGQVIELFYDCLSRVSTKRVWDPNSVLVNTITYKYDLMGRLYKVTDNTGTTKNTYDRAGRLIRVQYPGSKTVSYQYDACSNRTRLTYPDTSYITYDYDQLNRMTYVRNSGGTALASYTYDSRSRRTGLDYVNGAYVDYSYDAASRLLDVNNVAGNGQHKYAYLYDKVGNRTSMMVTDSGGTKVHVYTYDNIYQIKEVDYPVGFEYLATDTAFHYDAAGNRSSVIGGTGVAVTVNQEIPAAWLGTLVYTPESGYTGSDSFQWNGSDGSAYASSTAQATLTVRANANLALNKSVTASTSYTGYPASNATDGNTGTRWSSQYSDNEWIYVDLGSAFTINRVVLRWQASYGSGYKIQVSDNASSWSDVYTTTTGDGGVDDITLSSPASGRYVRMLGTQRATQWGYSLWEFEVYSDDTATGEPLTSLASGKAATASTTYTGFPASNVTDNNLSTRWSSQFSDNEWIYVNLGSSRTISRVVLRWEAAYGRGYKLQVSENASSWSEVYSTSVGDGGVDDITLSSPATGQYVRMLGTERATAWGYSLYEFQVYGPSSPNHAPTVSNIRKSGTPNTLLPLAAGNFMGGFADTDTGDYLHQVKITSLPGHGTLTAAGTCTYTANSLNQYTAAGTVSYQYDDSGNMVHDATYAYGYDPENRLVKVKKSGDLPALTLGQALDSPCVYTTDGNANWAPTRTELYYGNSCAASGTLSAQGQSCWLQTTVEGPGTVKFWCKTESSSGSNDLKFYIGDQLTLSGFNGTRDWEEMEFPVTGSGTHTLKWLYTRGSPTSGGNGYVDWVQWSGTQPPAPPEPGPDAWRTLSYLYDAAGRRIAKQYDGLTVLTYVYDGDHCIAEYDAYGNVKRKYIYGPCTDEPISMTETTGSYAGTYYYHFDALGSVVTLTNSSGNTVEVYEYDVFGRVGASDASHPNRFMFTGREYDKETGLYYYRARYYNPQIGRFLQTDPIGYADGMNWYAYCKNNSVNCGDPAGTDSGFTNEDGVLGFWWIDAEDKKQWWWDDKAHGMAGKGMDDWLAWMDSGGPGVAWMQQETGWTMAGWSALGETRAAQQADQKWWFIRLTAVMGFDGGMRGAINAMETNMNGRYIDRSPWRVKLRRSYMDEFLDYDGKNHIVQWNPGLTHEYRGNKNWYTVNPLALLAHELSHAYDDYLKLNSEPYRPQGETFAMAHENTVRYNLYLLDPASKNLWPRPGYGPKHNDCGSTIEEAWRNAPKLPSWEDPQ